MFAQRYECRRDNTGTWNVFDTFVGRVCLVGDQKVERLRESDAVEFTEILNGAPQTVTLQ